MFLRARSPSPAVRFAWLSAFAVLAGSACSNGYAESTLLSAADQAVESTAASHDVARVLQRGGEWVAGAQEKCFPHSWKGGDAARFAVAVESELCLRARMGEGLPLADMRTEIAAQSVGNATLLESELNLFAARAGAWLPVTGSPTAEAEVLVLGYQVWTDSISAPELEFTRDFTLLNFDKAVSAPFNIGPVPATVSAGVRARLDARVSGTLALVNARGNLTPKLASGGYAQVAVDAMIARGGVEGTLELLNDTVHLDGKVGLGVDVTQNPPQVFFAGEALGTNQLAALSGAIRMFAETAGDGRMFEREFFRWEGIRQDTELFRKTFAPRPLFRAQESSVAENVGEVATR
jgi:hypothetical protein